MLFTTPIQAKQRPLPTHTVYFILVLCLLNCLCCFYGFFVLSFMNCFSQNRLRQKNALCQTYYLYSCTFVFNLLCRTSYYERRVHISLLLVFVFYCLLLFINCDIVFVFVAYCCLLFVVHKTDSGKKTPAAKLTIHFF